MYNRRKYLSILIIVAVLYGQATQILLAEDVQSDTAMNHHLFIPMISIPINVTAREGALVRAPTTVIDVGAVSDEQPERESDMLGTDTVRAASTHRLYWTPWVSEENGNPPTYCTQWNEGTVGFGCRGRYCDDIRLYCETFPHGITLDSNTNYWTDRFSEEDSGIGSWISVGWYPYDGDNYEVCNRGNTGGVVQGFKCNGSYCDNISLECSVPVRYVNGVRDPATMTNCAWSGWYSEEQGSIDFGWNKYITGVECSGRYCDNKRFHICSVAP